MFLRLLNQSSKTRHFLMPASGALQKHCQLNISTEPSNRLNSMFFDNANEFIYFFHRKTSAITSLSCAGFTSKLSLTAFVFRNICRLACSQMTCFFLIFVIEITQGSAKTTPPTLLRIFKGWSVVHVALSLVYDFVCRLYC